MYCANDYTGNEKKLSQREVQVTGTCFSCPHYNAVFSHLYLVESFYQEATVNFGENVY